MYGLKAWSVLVKWSWYNVCSGGRLRLHTIRLLFTLLSPHSTPMLHSLFTAHYSGNTPRSIAMVTKSTPPTCMTTAPPSIYLPW